MVPLNIPGYRQCGEKFLGQGRDTKLKITRAGFVKPFKGNLYCPRIAYKKPLVHQKYSRLILT